MRKAVEGGTLDTCENIVEDIQPVPNRDGLVAKVPVVLAELEIQFNIFSEIDFPEDVLEVKNIKKRVKITQCRLLPETNVLFIEGFIRKNIDYTTPGDCPDSSMICGDFRHCTVDVPFQCTTPVDFNGRNPLPLIRNTSEEFEYFREDKLPKEDFAEKDRLLSGDLSEYNQISTEYFNELPFCELISAKIIEMDEFIDRKEIRKAPFEERKFRKITEKMVLYLKLKLLQKQQVKIPPGC